MGDTSKEQFERHNPEHPLPEELKNLERDQTVCKFCGVSYLIHNEIKALEDKLRAAENELEHYKGSMQREAEVRAELVKVQQDLKSSKDDVASKDNIIKTMTNTIHEKEEEIEKTKSSLSKTNEELSYTTQALETFKLKCESIGRKLPYLKTQVAEYKNTLEHMKSELQTHQSLVKEQCSQVLDGVSSTCGKQVQEIRNLNAKVVELENERLSSKFKEDKLSHQIKSLESQLSSSHAVEADVGRLKQERAEANTRIKELEAELDKTTKNHRNLEVEINQYKDQIRKHTLEVERVNNIMKSKEDSAQLNIARIQKELSEKEQKYDQMRSELLALKRMHEDTLQQQEEIKRKANASIDSTDNLKDALQRTRADCDALKNEREMMINAHQNQIEQLRESFKNKIFDAEKWPKRLEDALTKERQKHAAEMAALQEKLKESFIMEMQIEKQKHQKLLDKYLEEIKESEVKLRNAQNGYSSRHQSEISDLHKQIAEYKARSREMENSLRKEIESLKRIIKDLEARLAKFDGGNDIKVVELKQKLSSLSSDYEEAKEEITKLETKLSSANEESAFLQETVRRECEERFELTEALSSLKEELLTYKKPPGGYNSVSKHPSTGNGSKQRVSSSVSNTSAGDLSVASHSSTIGRKDSDTPSYNPSIVSPRTKPESKSSSEEMTLFKKVNRVPHPPGGTNTGTRESKDRLLNRDTADSNRVNVGPYETDSSKFQNRGLKGGTLGDARRRLAQMVAKR